MICSAGEKAFLNAVHSLGRRYGLRMLGVIQKPIRPDELKEFLSNFAGGNESTASVSHAFDRSFFDEVCSAMGREWVIKALTSLTLQIETTLSEEALASADRDQVARGAHALASYAGMLGFSEFANFCRTLEEAPNTDREFAPLLLRAQNASRSVCNKARELIVDLS